METRLLTFRMVFYYWPWKYFQYRSWGSYFLENYIFLLTFMVIFPLLTLRVIFSLPPFFTTDLESDIFTTTFFYYWPWEWYFWGGCLPEQPVACGWSPGKGQGSLHCLSDGNCTEIPWCCASLITPSTSRYNVNNHNGLFLLYVF